MEWTKFIINISSSAEDIVSFSLSELGIDSFETVNNEIYAPDIQGDFYELRPEKTEEDGRTRIIFYEEAEKDSDETLRKVRDKLEELDKTFDIGLREIEIENTRDDDWKDKWKEYFHSFTVGNIFVKPTWEDMPKDIGEKTLVLIDPGMSFGTGQHESTKLIIEKMDKYLKEGDEILDVGCGSGILSIIAIKEGAQRAVGTDIDPDSIRSAYENFKVNDIPKEKGDFYKGNLIDDEVLLDKVGRNRFPLVFSNILADIIIKMAPSLYEVTADKGILMTSGIIDFKEDEVDKALKAAGFKILEHNEMGEWRSIIAKKSA